LKGFLCSEAGSSYGSQIFAEEEEEEDEEEEEYEEEEEEEEDEEEEEEEKKGKHKKKKKKRDWGRELHRKRVEREKPWRFEEKRRSQSHRLPTPQTHHHQVEI